MSQLKERLNKANVHYRQALYDRFVTELGLGVGAVVKVESHAGYNRPPTESLGTIVSFDLGDVNLFKSTDSYRLDSDYKGNINIVVRVGSEEKTLSLLDVQVQTPKGRTEPWAQRSYGGWNSVKLIETVAPSKQPLDEEWVSNCATAFEWLLKKRTEEWMRERGMLKTIANWSI